MNRFGRFIRERREKNGMTQNDLAVLIGTTSRYVSNVERGVVLPSIKSCDYISQTTGWSLLGLCEARFNSELERCGITDIQIKVIPKK